MRTKAGEEAPMSAGSPLGGRAERPLDTYNTRFESRDTLAGLHLDCTEVASTMFYEVYATMSSS